MYLHEMLPLVVEADGHQVRLTYSSAASVAGEPPYTLMVYQDVDGVMSEVHREVSDHFSVLPPMVLAREQHNPRYGAYLRALVCRWQEILRHPTNIRALREGRLRLADLYVYPRDNPLSYGQIQTQEDFYDCLDAPGRLRAWLHPDDEHDPY